MTMTSQSKSELAKREGSIWFVGGAGRTPPQPPPLHSQRRQRKQVLINISKQKESVESHRNISDHGSQPQDDHKRARRRHRPTRDVV